MCQSQKLSPPSCGLSSPEDSFSFFSSFFFFESSTATHKFYRARSAPLGTQCSCILLFLVFHLFSSVFFF
ncbi:GPI-anchored surface protein, putative [Bodo saltans]|uniref:GPI-anchored surface protein, putative n=1 Tax=Bodo saltans TaxID=75058 RepID=A0A0S4IX36_BODSA|nr:GPI-anchored surface protein, putative [Bodo saltans]|eukprot:CUG35947.1 GPI-anchored surface protein, putative [Bodo saltans]